ncbi:MAG: hypothetical protein M3R06_02880 [Chloroflexota bacterium]|nr:hypothetical protein [Chloroflexota bacterium]
MTIPVGRRHLVLTLIPRPATSRPFDLPSAAEASDAELATIQARRDAHADRLRWEAMAIVYGQRL